MGDLTENLSRYEILCKCGKCDLKVFDAGTASAVQECLNSFKILYPEFDLRLNVNSGNRCPEHNKAEGGSDSSQHLNQCAMDFYFYDKVSKKPINSDEVYDYLDKKYPTSYGIGKYVGRTHLDSRSVRARWDTTV